MSCDNLIHLSVLFGHQLFIMQACLYPNITRLLMLFQHGPQGVMPNKELSVLFVLFEYDRIVHVKR